VKHIDQFTDAYIECALWSSTDNADDSGGEPLDSNYGPEDIAPETYAQMVLDCESFQGANAGYLEMAGDAARNGHDFWLTRNHHGAGFWDRGYPGNVGDILTERAHAYGEVDLMVGDDGMIYS
jgi:hypothetical protein